ncbi:hypothetical protein HYG86_06975 [Alkalicella caledoniensis]|uniref:Uncharacterized protein n=1 Tax=Alkalicella caledoniensis TaxID=2731377 RepID=A0A7G9W778_ALKCA|nr:hypothetical protein [Alkalicella caledoniensis]QNO14540.1 hypothetical protein HYG86_06975 [Alkalicella caledoniensis]
MELTSVFNFVFSVIPRSFVAVYFCLSFIKLRPKVGQFVSSSLLFAFVIWISRAVFSFGFHSLVPMMFLAYILHHISYERLNSTFSIAVIYFTLLYIIDFFVLYIYNSITNLSIEQIWSLEFIRVILTIPASLFFLCVGFLIRWQLRRNLKDLATVARY